MLEARTSTGSDSPYTHYGYGVWMDAPGFANGQGSVRKYFVEGSDPGVALRSAVYPEEDIVLTMIGNTGDALWPLCRSIEESLNL
jgi:CubicO group peptidase (beta-lactamase class C family)